MNRSAALPSGNVIAESGITGHAQELQAPQKTKPANAANTAVKAKNHDCFLLMRI
jgi:hypothetical protein